MCQYLTGLGTCVEFYRPSICAGFIQVAAVSLNVGVIWTANAYIFEHCLLGLLIDMLDVNFCAVALAIMRSRQCLKISLANNATFYKRSYLLWTV